MLLEPGALAAPSLKSHQCNASTWAWNLAMGMVHEKSPARKLLGLPEKCYPVDCDLRVPCRLAG